MEPIAETRCRKNRERIAALAEIAEQIEQLAVVAHGLVEHYDSRGADEWLWAIRRATGHVSSQHGQSILRSAMELLDPDSRIGVQKDDPEGVLQDFLESDSTPEQFVDLL